ncbi:protein arginine kinase [Macrococcus carouselicus]|uniref:Protein-arginine kinase n=1 Tax=Macrococcus carouselicus TaxID=69969 RepID=A0A9Q8FPC7_9STAP|nr:protein arginine kinase [Macrococcus carouselicus]TDM00901.1 protein arginine kinase [Macrococcus carouselicus]
MLDKHLNLQLSDWMQQEDQPIILSSRIRLARNLENFVHPLMSDDETSEKVLQEVSDVLSEQFKAIVLRDLEVNDRQMLVIKHLVSKELLSHQSGATFLNDDESVSIMINEEDHIRIQVLGRDLSLDRLYEKAKEIDQLLDKKLTVSFDETLGYLTTCPTNIGTGLRASVMLHLPGLSIMKRMGRIAQAINRFGYTIRGIYGEGSQGLGHIYQVSNQLTLGKSEEAIINDLKQIVEQIITEEEGMRQRLLDYDYIETVDRINRSLGILKYARLISAEEASLRLSEVKMGIDMGIIPSQPFRFNELMVAIQPPFLNTINETLSINEKRAKILREHL